jgi:hypothetical protein
VHPGVDLAILIDRFKMRQETGGEIAVSATPFMNDEAVRLTTRRLTLAFCLIAFSHAIVIISRKGMGHPIICRSKRLRELAESIAAQSIEDVIDMSLPLIDGAKFPNELRQRIWIIEGGR